MNRNETHPISKMNFIQKVLKNSKMLYLLEMLYKNIKYEKV